MYRSQTPALIIWRRLTELMVTISAWVIAYQILGPLTDAAGLERLRVYTPVIMIFALVSFALAMIRELSLQGVPDFSEAIWHHFSDCVLSLIAVILTLYLAKAHHISRLYLVTGTIMSLVARTGWSYSWRAVRAHRKSSRMGPRRVVLVGHGGNLPKLAASVESTPYDEFELAGYITLGDQADIGELSHSKNLGALADLDRALDEEVIDVVVFGVYRQAPSIIEQAMLTCYKRGLDVWLKPDLMDGSHISRISYLKDIPLLVFALGPTPCLALGFKRVVDVMGSVTLLILLAPLMALIGILVKLTSSGPALFVQTRIGLQRRPFEFYKFRTMINDHRENTSSYNLLNEVDGPVFKMAKDPRVTSIGRFLRKHSLDELPQLWNVLWGDMSLVGPRPPLPHEVQLYQGWHQRRLSMRPGLTCLWQVTRRNSGGDFSEWVELDLMYIDEWSLWMDFKIVLRTILVVFKGTGC